MAKRKQENDSDIVLVGTFRSACHDWLLSKHGKNRKSYYNLPFHGEANEALKYKAFTAAFLFSSDYSPILSRVKYVGLVSAERLKKEFGYPGSPPKLNAKVHM